MANVYHGSVNSQGQILTRKQSTLLSRSLIVAGVGFLVIFAFAMLLYWGLSTADIDTAGSTLSGLYLVSFILIFASMFMSMYIWARIDKVKFSTVLMSMIFYGIAEGIAFGGLFYAISISASYDMWDIISIFAFAGMIFIISGLIGTVLTTKFTLSLGKILVVTTIAFLLVYFIAIMLTMFIPGAATNNFYYLIYAIFGLLMIGYIMYDFSIIKKMDGFVAAQHSEIQKKLVFMFGFKLLIDFVGLVWIIARFVLAAKR